MNPNAFDDLKKVNQRRNSIGLNTLQEQTDVIRHRVQTENQTSPRDLHKRKQQMDDWRKKVGWME
ncbi:MAG: hypothetical protein WAT37_14620 [Saprospiraceae bacterium]|jgi:hypothetical protein